MHHKIYGILAAWLIATACCGCDTVAELTFEEEQLIEAAVQGLVSPHCASQTTENAPDAIFRWSVLTSFDARMTPGRRYAALGDVLIPGTNFNAEDISFTDGWFFVITEDGTDMTCDTAADCPTQATCLTAKEMGIDPYYYAPSRFCVYPTTITPVNAPSFTQYKSIKSEENHIHSLNADGRTLAFILDNSATLDGSAENGIPDNTKATDPYQYRKVGLNQFMDGLSLSEDTNPRYELSAHFANGSGKTGVFDASPAWMRSIAVWESTVMNKYPSPSGGSPIWETAATALQKLQDSANTTYHHTAIVLTDGKPNDGTDEAYASFQRWVKAHPNLPLHWLELVTNGQTIEPRYAEMTTSGCGTHYIFGNPAQFSKTMRNLAINTESYWDIPLKFSAKLPTNHLYRLATTMVATIGQSAVTFEAHRINEQTETIDYRMVFGGK